MYKLSKSKVLGLTIFVILIARGDLFAKTIPDCEIGDAVFRYKQYEDILGVGFHHAGIYFCSHSKGDEVYVQTEDPYYIKITGSDLQHSVIEAVGYGGPISCQPFVERYIIYPGGYKGAYNSGTLDAYKRRKIIAAAWEQKGKKYATGNPRHPFNEKPTDIKSPGNSFRCDGLVEYCYEVIQYRGIDSGGNPCDNYGFFSSWEEKNCWFFGIPGIIHAVSAAFFVKKDAFYPKALLARMKKASGKQLSTSPQIFSFDLYKDGKEIAEGGLLKKNDVVTVKTFVTDGDKGSGIDRVELYYQEVYGQLLGKGTLTLITTLDDDEDIGKESSYDWTVPSTTITFLDCEVSAVAYDRTGNTIRTV
ncbi:MAG: hypothetical protein AB1422_15835 [bacterium]